MKSNKEQKIMKTLITNVVTNEKTLFVNYSTVVENVVSYILIANNMVSQLHNEKIRNKIIIDYNLKECISKVTNEKFCYCEKLYIYAKQITN